MNKKTIIFLIMAPLLGISLALGKFFYNIHYWTYSGAPKTFIVQPGEGFSSINYRLYKAGLISSKKSFYRYSKWNDLMTRFKSGHYQIESGMNMLAIISLLQTGKGMTTTVTIPEGKNLYEIAQILEQRKILSAKAFITQAKNKTLTQKYNIPADTFEGYLYPDTYELIPKTSSEEVIRVMVSNFKTKTKTIDYSLSHLSNHDVVTLASIVEKETGASFERAQIASVYLNRLRKKMRLYSDPTTIYGIFENFDGNLRKKHLQEKTPYNTYRISGLPKGPICNPGIAAIEAVLKPEKTDYLYFVSKNDGTHEFTTNYKDHLKAVDKWQRNRQNRVGKSWRDLKQQNSQ